MRVTFAAAVAPVCRRRRKNVHGIFEECPRGRSPVERWRKRLDNVKTYECLRQTSALGRYIEVVVCAHEFPMALPTTVGLI
jgi:hypothetical protein